MSLAGPRSSGISWPRLGAEAAIIIASILLALGVDEWRQERNDRELEREYLARLIDDLDANLQIAETQLLADSRKVKHARRIYPLVSKGDMAGLDPATAVTASYGASPSDTPTWVDDTFEELQSTGRLSLIQEADIRRSLLSYYRYLKERDWTYQLMSRAYRDAIRTRMNPDLQLEIRSKCVLDPACTIDPAAFELEEYVGWLSGNQELTEGLNRVIVQWTRGSTEYLPRVQIRTNELKKQIEAELSQ